MLPDFAAADGALDDPEALALSETLTVPVGTFKDALRTLETTQLEPDVLEHKLDAPGFGPVLIEEGFENGEPPTLIPLRSIGFVPAPAAVGLGAGCLGLSS